jgi:hypothetical protein
VSAARADVSVVAGTTPRPRGGAAAFPKIEASHVTDRDIVGRLRSLADRARRLPAPCHRRPNAFLEAKDELAHEIDELVAEIEIRLRLRQAPAR